MRGPDVTIERKTRVVLVVAIVSLLLFATATEQTGISGEAKILLRNLLYSSPETNEVIDAHKKRFICEHQLTKCSSTTPQNWCLDTEGNPRYVGKDGHRVKISHYTHSGFDRCLANKSIIFIGDSRVRYQFMALAYFLRSRKHLRCADFQVNGFESYDGSECYLINERLEAHDWNHWYETSTAALGSNSTPDGFGQSSLCDCFRNPKFTPNTTMENRYIKRRSPFGQLDLVYLQSFKNLVRITKDFPPFQSFDALTRCNPGRCDPRQSTMAYSGDLNRTLWAILPKLNTTHAFVNLGWDNNGLSDFSCLIEKFSERYPNINVYIITHPPGPEGKPLNVTTFECQVNVLDRSQLTNVPHNWYWDNLHVLSIMNEEYNHQLVEKICPLEPDE